MVVKLTSQEVEYDPLCPHCSQEIKEVHVRKIKSWGGGEYVMICPNCKKVIGVGRK